jgi:preprotein translocase subunit SecD
MTLLKNWKIILLIAALLLSIGLILFNSGADDRGYLAGTNIRLGLDFVGGTLLQVELAEEVSTEQIARIASIISQRIDPSGLSDTIVTPIGNKFIAIQLSETNASEIEKIESRIRQQGNFVSTINGSDIFTGDQILRILRGDTSYGVYQTGTAFEWRLPFVLNEAATNSFTEKTFHQCSAVSYTATGQPIYDCESTTFFLDRPESIVIVSEEQYNLDRDYLFLGDRSLSIPQQTDIDEVIEDSQVDVLIYSEDFNISQIESIKNEKGISSILISEDINSSFITSLENRDFDVEVIEITNEPWVWNTLNARQIIALTEGITNENVGSLEEASKFSTLFITGQRETFEEAESDLEELAILLESGSLPTPVKSISRETISASLGESFQSLVLIMGIIAFIVVGIIIALRYRNWQLIIPIFIIGASEVIINLGFIALTARPLDLAAFAGLIAAIGTGIDSEIVITDEIMSKRKVMRESIIGRAKAALFIIMTAAFTMISVMFPIIAFSRAYPGIEKLYGFAVVAIVGALIGVFITRPAFTVIIQKIAGKIEKKK